MCVIISCTVSHVYKRIQITRFLLFSMVDTFVKLLYCASSYFRFYCKSFYGLVARLCSFLQLCMEFFKYVFSRNFRSYFFRFESCSFHQCFVQKKVLFRLLIIMIIVITCLLQLVTATKCLSLCKCECVRL